MEFDQVLDQVGGFGRFQCLNYALLLLPTAHTAIFMMTYIFAARDIPYRCYVPECDARGPQVLEPPWLPWAVPPSPVPRPWPGLGPPPHSCLRFLPFQPQQSTFDADAGEACSPGAFDTNRTLRCDRWVFPDHEKTVVSEFNVTCEENRWRLTSVGSLNFLGQLLGMPFSGMFSDRFGRRTLLCVVLPLSWLCGMARSFATSFNAYVMLELLDSFFAAGIYSACFLLGLELVTGPRRVVGNSLVASFYSLGCVYLGAVAWLQPDWRWMMRLSYLPTAASVVAVWLLPESVRWLLSRHRVEEAQALLRRVAAANGVPLTAPLPLLALLDAGRSGSRISKASSSSVERPRGEGVPGAVPGSWRSALVALRGWPVVQVCRSSLLLRRLCICASLWVVNAFVYFGLALRSVALAGDLHLNFILAALVEMPSYVLAWWGSERWGRRVCLSVTLTLTGTALLAFLVVPTGLVAAQLALYLTGKLAITASFTVLYVFTAELFPTNARHSVVGLCSSIGRLGSTLAPQTPLMEVFFWGMPLLVFGLMCVGGALMALLLPETLRQALPDSVSQAKAVGAGPRPPQR